VIINIQIKNADFSDCREIAKIHKECLTKSFLATLGEKFLTLLYKTLVEYKKGILLVAEDNGKIIGFVSATADTGGFYKYFLKKKFIEASFLLLPKAINLNTLRKIFETLKYSKKNKINILLPKAELLSIAVKEDYQRKGVAQQLFKALAKEFYKKGINEFKIVVGDSLLNAKKFYRKMGCIKVGEFELHKGERSEIYIFKIK